MAPNHHLEEVGHGAQSGVGNRPSLRHIGGDDGLAAVAAARAGKEAFPNAANVITLIGGELPSNDQTDQTERGDRAAAAGKSMGNGSSPPADRTAPSRTSGLVLGTTAGVTAAETAEEPP